MIQTVKKPLKIKDFSKGIIFGHEHLNFDLRHIRNDETSFLSDFNLIKEELKPAIEDGLSCIVEVSNQSMQSNKEKLFDLSNELNIPIVAATGYYLNEYEKNNSKTIEELEKEFSNHILVGVGANKIKCGIIGEIATSSDEIHDFEKRVFTAACNTQKKLGVPIYTHVNTGDNAMEHLELLLKLGADPKRTIIGHAEFIDKKIIKEILKHKFYIGIDTIGKSSYLSDEKRAELIKELIDEGYEDQIVTSLDISKQDYLAIKGGHGYGYMTRTFLKTIKDNVNDAQVRKITRDNILKVLDYI